MALPAGRRGVRPDQVKPDGTLNVTEPTPYELPVASAETLGGVKVGSGLSIADGVLSASGYSLPTASAETLGGIKVGSGLSIADGVLSASGGGGVELISLDTTEHNGAAFTVNIPTIDEYDGIAISMDVNGSSTGLQQLSFMLFVGDASNNEGVVMSALIQNSEINLRFRKVTVNLSTKDVTVGVLTKCDLTGSGVAIATQNNVGYVKHIYGIKLS